MATHRQRRDRRKKALNLLDRGLTAEAAARRVGVSARTVFRWKAAFLARGPSALEPRKGAGRPRRLAAEDLRALREMLALSPRLLGYPVLRWKRAIVADLIQRRFGVAYHVDHVRRLLPKRT